MESTVIAIMLASVAVFWKAPFAVCLIPAAKTLQHRWRQIIFIILLLALITSQTHTAPLAAQAARCRGETYAAACQESLKMLTIPTLNTQPIF